MDEFYVFFQTTPGDIPHCTHMERLHAARRWWVGGYIGWWITDDYGNLTRV